MLPRVIVHNMVSVDGRLDWFKADVGLFYETAKNWAEDCTLAGSETLLTGAAEAGEDEMLAPVDPPEAGDTRPLLAVVDSRGRIKGWSFLRSQPYWRGVVALCSDATPPAHLQMLEARGVPTIVAGIERVDLREALDVLNQRFGVKVVRVDSGGTLNGVLLRRGLVSVVSVLIHPALVGGFSPSSIFRANDLADSSRLLDLRLAGVERLAGDVVWLRYLVAK